MLYPAELRGRVSFFGVRIRPNCRGCCEARRLGIGFRVSLAAVCEAGQLGVLRVRGQLGARCQMKGSSWARSPAGRSSDGGSGGVDWADLTLNPQRQARPSSSMR